MRVLLYSCLSTIPPIPFPQWLDSFRDSSTTFLKSKVPIGYSIFSLRQRGDRLFRRSSLIFLTLLITSILLALRISFTMMVGTLFPESAPGLAHFVIFPDAEESGRLLRQVTQQQAPWRSQLLEWAKKTGSLLLSRDRDKVGLAYWCPPDRLSRYLEITAASDGKESDQMAASYGLYVDQDSTFTQLYVRDNCLQTYSEPIPISGYWSAKAPYRSVFSEPLLYPAAWSDDEPFDFYTDASNLDSIEDIFRKSGYQVSFISKPFSWDLIREMWQNAVDRGLYSWAHYICLFALLFLLIDLETIFYRKLLRPVQVHWLFGLSRLRLAAFLLLRLASILILTQIGVQLLGQDTLLIRNFHPRNTFMFLFFSVSALILPLTHTGGYLWLRKKAMREVQK